MDNSLDNIGYCIESYNKKCTILGVDPIRIDVRGNYVVARGFISKNIESDAIIPTFVSIIGFMAFSKSKVRRVKMKSIEKIQEQAFYSCKNLIEINIDSEVIESKAFEFCINLETVRISDRLNKLGEFAFSECWKLKRIRIPGSLKEISRGAFSNCMRLRDIIIEEGVKEIASGAFSICKSIEEIYIPDSVERIGDFAFSQCENLRVAYINKKTRVSNNAFDRGIRIVYR